jgi:hypothetical protein
MRSYNNVVTSLPVGTLDDSDRWLRMLRQLTSPKLRCRKIWSYLVSSKLDRMVLRRCGLLAATIGALVLVASKTIIDVDLVFRNLTTR